MTFKYKIPDAKTPGYLRREKKRLEFLALGAQVNKKPELYPEYQEAMIDWLLEYIVAPKDRKAAINALLDASQDEIDDLQTAILSGEGGADPKASDSSEDG